MGNNWRIQKELLFSDEEIRNALFEIIDERFDERVILASNSYINSVIGNNFHPYSTWHVSVDPELTQSFDGHTDFTFRCHRQGVARLGGKYSSKIFEDWFSYYIRHRLAEKIDAVIVDVDDTGKARKPDSSKYPTIQDWVRQGIVDIYGEDIGQDELLEKVEKKLDLYPDLLLDLGSKKDL